jgi:4-amino-4-deoxy-L-arabinose transferase-like glycosyltransferase
MDFLQNLIHRLEVGGGVRYVRLGLVGLAVAVLFAGYNWRAWRNMTTLEAMDAAQVGRNLAEGKGYTTLFVRPLSIYLVKKCNDERLGPPALGVTADHAELKGMHPDLANPPVYPVVLAGLMKVLPFHFEAYDSTARPVPFWTNAGRFWRYQPDFLITVFNQLLLLAVVALTFLLARRLFGWNIALLSGALVLGTELLWRFSVSGLSTMLLMLLFVCLTWCLALFEEEMREPRGGLLRGLLLAAAAGLLAGVGGLTRYSFAWLVVPVVVFVVVLGGQRRWFLGGLTLVTFLLVFAPWIARNVYVSGVPFGTASYVVIENTGPLPEFRLQRSLDPNLVQPFLRVFWYKLISNARHLVSDDLPRLAGNWLSAFFIVGLLLKFPSPGARRLRYFLVGSLAVLALAQTIGKTHLSEESPDLNSENLLVLLAPLVIVYGVSLFYSLLDQIDVPARELRYGVIGLFAALVCLPLVLVFLPPKTVPVAYPPYYPPAVQKVAGWHKPNELIMSDIPWAVAWYGNRQCVWLSLNAQSEYLAISDYLKPINTLYLTPVTMDSKFLTQWVQPGDYGWGSFILTSILKKDIPPNFPLRKSPPGWMPAQFVLTDWERYRPAGMQDATSE